MSAEVGRESRVVGELLLQVAVAMERLVATATGHEGLTSIEGRALRCLRDRVPQHELAAMLGCDAARVSGVVRRLQAKGLVRQSVGDDRRVRLVTLTDAGRGVLERIGAELNARSPIVHRLDSDGRSELHALLRRLIPDPLDPTLPGGAP